MPALLFMGRRWGVGADELALPSLCSMALRVAWSAALVVILVRLFQKSIILILSFFAAEFRLSPTAVGASPPAAAYHALAVYQHFVPWGNIPVHN